MVAGGLGFGAFTAVTMILVAITGSGNADNALTLLVVGGVLLLLVGLAMIAYAVWPEESVFESPNHAGHAWDRMTERMAGAAGPLAPAHRSRYETGPAGQGASRHAVSGGEPEWTIPQWDPPEDFTPPPRSAPQHRRPQRRQPHTHVSKFDV